MKRSPVAAGDKIATAPFIAALDRPVSNDSLVLYRVAFGLIMAWHTFSLIANGLVTHWFVDPAFLFSYYGFGWVKPLPGAWIMAHFAVTLLAALGIAAGFFYRTSCATFFVGWTWFWLLEKSVYQNHTYLVSLIAFWLIFMPANGRFAVDATRRPALRTSVTPQWCVWLLRVLMGMVYFYAGIAKLYPDWLQGEPMRAFYAQHADFPVLGPLVNTPFWAVGVASWGGLVFDLAIPFLLVWRRTRPVAFVLAVGFHTTNSLFFSIDIFPVLAIATTTLFLAPDWPSKLLGRLRKRDVHPPADTGPLRGTTTRGLRVALALFLLVQLLLPFHHMLYPGDHNWTEEGHRFSWFLVQRDKKGRIMYLAKVPETGQQFRIEPDKYLNPRQVRKLAINPDMMLQFAHFMERELQKDLPGDIEIYVVSRVRLNRRDYAPLVAQDLDLSRQPRHWGHYDWIAPHPGPMLPVGVEPRFPPFEED